MSDQGLSRHMYPPLSYSAHRSTEIVGIFYPAATTTTSYWRGAGWTVTNPSTGVYTLVLDEPIRLCIFSDVHVMSSAADGSDPFLSQIVGPASDGKTFTIKVCRVYNDKESQLTSPSAADDRISFTVESEESTGRIR